ncbi:MAG: GAF domain-containing protein [Candidatus Manganitrophus sp. SA1]|nr:GAF domain-containing protein [Candidatus Manganitrophus morganii]
MQENGKEKEKEQNRDETKGALRRLSEIQSIAETTLSHLSLDHFLNNLVDRVRQIFMADTVAILLLDEESRTLAVRAAYGLEEEVDRVRIPVGQGVAGRILSERRSLIIDDLSKVEVASPILREKGVRSLLGAPLRVQDHLMGVIHVGCFRPRRFGEEERRLLELIAEQVGLATEHARLYEAEWHSRAGAQAAERRYRALVDGLDHSIVWEADAAANRFFFVSSRAETILGYPVEQWLTEPRFWEARLHPADRENALTEFRKLVSEGKDRRFDHRMIAADGRAVWFHTGMSLSGVTETGTFIHGISMDITPLKQVEAATRAREAQQTMVASLGQRALEGTDIATLMNQAVALVARCLEVEYSKILELLPDGKRLLLRAGVGWEEDSVGRATVDTRPDSQAGYTLLSKTPVITEDLRTERRFTGAALLDAHQVISGMTVLIQGHDRPFGVLGAHTIKRRAFNEEDIHFLQAIANVLTNAIERKQIEETLRQKTTEAEEANRLKSELVSIVSHELRTPLNAIIGYSSLMKDPRFQKDPAKLKEMQERIYENSRTLLELINRILDVSKIEAGQRDFSLELEPVSVSDAARQATDNLKPMGEQRGLSMEFIDDASAPTIQSDPAKLKQILTNLISNAIKYTEQGSVVVRIRHQPEEKKVCVEVRDTGRGIAEEDLPYLFEPYYHVVATESAPQKGTGLGLSIVKKLVEALGGTVDVASQVGIGSIFTIRLPYQIPKKEESTSQEE